MQGAAVQQGSFVALDPESQMTDTETRSMLALQTAEYGEIEIRPLSRVQVLTAKATTRNWTAIPHVTHNDRFDVTALEAARAAREPRLSPLPYLLKAAGTALAAHPMFNAVLDEGGTQVLLRRYVNVGFAIDAPKGLLVAVVRDCDRKSVEEIGADVAALSEKARTKGLSLAEMTGGGFTVSSLGQLGGTSFTPIINGSEVAILGVSRLEQVAVPGEGGQVAWRKMLPVSLSYDHRVLNGADVGRFLATLQKALDAQA